MPAISTHVPTIMLNSLTGFGFEVDGQNQTCGHFTTRLRNYVVRFCQFYELEIATELANPNCVKRKDDLDSWAINETTQILFEAMGRYRDRVADAEAILVGRQRIGCEQALTYFVWLIELTEAVKRARLEQQRTAVPSSRKFQKKKKSNRWTPYAVDVVWEELKRVFGTSSRG